MKKTYGRGHKDQGWDETDIPGLFLDETYKDVKHRKYSKLEYHTGKKHKDT
jgi:hypothetical protein